MHETQNTLPRRDLRPCQTRLRRRLWFLLTTSFIPSLLLLLIRQCRQSARDLADLDVLQRRGQGTSVVLDKGVV